MGRKSASGTCHPQRRQRTCRSGSAFWGNQRDALGAPPEMASAPGAAAAQALGQHHALEAQHLLPDHRHDLGNAQCEAAMAVRHQHAEYANAPQCVDNIVRHPAAALDLFGASGDVRREITDGGE